MADAGPSERRRDKVLKSISKGAFLDMLKGNRLSSKSVRHKLQNPNSLFSNAYEITLRYMLYFITEASNDDRKIREFKFPL